MHAQHGFKKCFVTLNNNTVCVLFNLVMISLLSLWFYKSYSKQKAVGPVLQIAPKKSEA